MKIGEKSWRGQWTCALCVVVAGVTFAGSAAAQSFFASIVTDPAAGVDRGATSGIRDLDETTRFLTFDSFGSEEVGPYVLGFGVVVPDAIGAGDQLDVVGVVAGPSSEDDLELRAGGFGYRVHLGEGLTAFGTLNLSDARLGSAASRAQDIRGSLASTALGLRQVRQLGEMAKLTTTAEMIARRGKGSLLGFPFLDEELRLVRLSARYEEGFPFFAQRRFAVALTKGFDDFGASDVANPLASRSGATSEFLRASFSAEFSVPVSEEWVVNAGLIGQWSGDSLPSSQQCGFGTNSYARGFDLGYVAGDQCLGSRVELAFNVEAPSVDEVEGIRFTQAYFGVDAGRLWNNDNAVLPATRDSWSSGSLGVRSIRGDFIGEAAVTRIFDEPAGLGGQDETRFWVRAAVRF